MLFGLTATIQADTAATAKHKVVIQVSTDDPRTQTIAMYNGANLQKLYGIDNVDIEIVANGPGLGILTKKSKLTGRVKSMELQDI